MNLHLENQDKSNNRDGQGLKANSSPDYVVESRVAGSYMAEKDTYPTLQKTFAKEEGGASTSEQDNRKFVTLRHLNDYFASLKTQLGEKVGLNEVQLALGDMQHKL